jgi:uncharacterized protein (TIGR02246 family)
LPALPVRLTLPCTLIGATAALLLIGCGEKRSSQQQEVKALMDTSRAWANSVATGDVDTIMNYWTDDAVVVMPGEPVRKGQAEIRRYVEASLKTPGFAISWEPIEGAVSSSGDIGYLVERSRISFPDGHGGIAHQALHGVTVWRKQPDGSWKDAIDISTPDAAVPPQPAAKQ